MPRDGSGNFALAEPAFVNGTIIDADVMNADLSDVAAGLTQSVSKDGQTVPTANLPMGGFKHTNVASATNSTDYARADQVTGSVLDYAPDTGTATAYAIAPSPAITAYAVGQRFAFKALHANSGADPTLAVNSLTPGIVYYPDGTSLAAADITLNGLYEVLVASVTTGTPTFHLQSTNAGVVRKAGTQTIAGAKTFSATLAMSAAALNEAVRVDVASATTTDIGAAASNYVRITGTTTITGLGTVASGVRRKVVFGGALLLTYNVTSLILPGAASITTAAGDCAEFESEGSGNWRCTDYQAASGKPVLSGQVVTTQVSARSVLTGTIPFDDTIPQSTEGDQAMTLAITPISATSKLKIDVVVFGASVASEMTTIALFKDSEADARSANGMYSPALNVANYLTYTMTSGTTSSITFKVRAGGAASNFVINGTGVGRIYGGVAASSITITETP